MKTTDYRVLQVDVNEAKREIARLQDEIVGLRADKTHLQAQVQGLEFATQLLIDKLVLFSGIPANGEAPPQSLRAGE